MSTGASFICFGGRCGVGGLLGGGRGVGCGGKDSFIRVEREKALVELRCGLIRLAIGLI